MPSSSSVGRISCSGSRHQSEVLALERRDRLDGVSAADRLRAGFREPEMLDLALANQVLHRTRDVFDRNVRVDAMLVEQVDAIRPKSLQRRVGDGANLRRMAVEPRHLAVLDVEAELGGDRDLIADGLERFADDILIGIRAVHFGRIEERHAARRPLRG